MPKITIQAPAGTNEAHSFDAPLITVGRSPTNLLVVADPAASRYHLEIRQERGRWVVADGGSRNGTLLNGRKVKRPRKLRDGDEITVGDTVLMFEADAGAEYEEPGEEPGEAPGEEPVALPPEDEEMSPFLGDSPAMETAMGLLRKYAASEVPVLVKGEPGTGKAAAARMIHVLSPRGTGPFVRLECTGAPGPLFEAELLGTGRPSGSTETAYGRLGAAAGGTLFLEEVGDLDAAGQAILLRVLDRKEAHGTSPREAVVVNARIVASTCLDLEVQMRRGSFRQDLYYRLSALSLTLPPLRDRGEDLLALVDCFLDGLVDRKMDLHEEAWNVLRNYHFPGNVRELHRILKRAVVLAEGQVIRPRDLPAETLSDSGKTEVDPTLSDDLADQLLRRVINEGESFWELVREPYRAGEIDREVVKRFVERVYNLADSSYREAARLLHMEDDYRRFLRFIHDNGFDA